MEADWEFEIADDAPAIVACWSGFVDLRWRPNRDRELRALVRSLPEIAEFPALAITLEKLNSQSSPVWTSKCDFWPTLEPEDFDHDELDAAIGQFAHAMGCYIDLLPKSDQQWTLPHMISASCKYVCNNLHAVPLRCCRVDLIIRRAMITPDIMDTGITAYLTACGPTPAVASQTLEAALAAFADALCPHSTLQLENTGE
jgi:hypothetical protein